MKRALFIDVLCILIVAAAAAFLAFFHRFPAQVPMANQGALTNTPRPYVPEQQTEKTVVEPVPYFPAPSINLTGAKLGTQRVPGLETIGDIGQLYFHMPSDSLFMTVVEPDGLRAIWRLAANGKADRVFAATPGPGQIAIFGDSHGVMYVQHDNPCKLYRSDDAFRTCTAHS